MKDIQDTAYGFSPDICRDVDLVVACNINFNRELLALAKEAGKPIATDVHVLSDPWDPYNREFLSLADIVFLSDEGIGSDYAPFLRELAGIYHPKILVLGRGSRGAALVAAGEDRIWELPAVQVGPVVNTAGAGDALFSAFLHYHVRGLEPVEALKRAQLFAAAKITVSGSAKGFLPHHQVEELYRIHGSAMSPR